MAHFSAQVGERRKLARLSLSELAARSGVSKATISKVERQEIQPSLDVAARLAEGLGVTLSEMLHQTPRARVVVQRAGDHVEVEATNGGFLRRVLSPTFDQAALEFIQFSFPPGSRSGVFPPHRYGTEEYIYILEGELQLHINDEDVLLGPGDSIYYEAQCTHELINAGATVVTGFAVIKR